MCIVIVWFVSPFPLDFVCGSCDLQTAVSNPKQASILRALQHMRYSKVRHTWCAPPACLKGLKTQSLLMNYHFISAHISNTFFCSKIEMSRLTILGKVSVCIRFAGRCPSAGIVFSISSVISSSVVISVLVSPRLIFCICEKLNWCLFLFLFLYSLKIIYFVSILVLFYSKAINAF